MKIAFISDIHANIDAFEAVLKIIDNDEIDLVFIAGDLVGYYYDPDRVIDICMNRANISCIKGNHEVNFLNALENKEDMKKHTEKYGSSYRKTKEKLSDRQINWLASLPDRLDFELEQVSFTMVHDTANSVSQYVYPDHSKVDLINQLTNSQYTILGHTHYPFVWCQNNKWLLNPGSVGQPRDHGAMASFLYLNLTNQVLEPKKVRFPTEKLIEEIKINDPDNEYLASIFMRGT